MFTQRIIQIEDRQKKDKEALAGIFRQVVSDHHRGPVFIIGSWQSGDFSHIYAAAVRHFSIDHNTPFALIVINAEGFGVKTLLADIKFAIEPICTHGSFTLYHNEKPISKNIAIELMSKQLMTMDNAREPFDATFWAEESVKSMTKGQPLTPVWADLARGKSKEHFEAYASICQSFMEDYVKRFGLSNGREKFVCLWGRTSGRPTPTRKLGGANPQYDSSETGNQQLCLYLKHKIPSIRAVFIVGDGFNAQTKSLPHVFDLGAFWSRQNKIMGRFQENGFFDYMTAFYDCDVVHVGMKSGGMDTLGVWGQKVVFIDSMRSPEITKARVAAWSTAQLMPVEVSQMPTPLGKAIESERAKNPSAFKTTFSSAGKVKAMEEKAQEFDDLFENVDLDRIAAAVNQMFG